MAAMCSDFRRCDDEMPDAPPETTDKGGAPLRNVNARGRRDAVVDTSPRRRNPGFWGDARERWALLDADPSYVERGWSLQSGPDCDVNFGTSRVVHTLDGIGAAPAHLAILADGSRQVFGDASAALAWIEANHAAAATSPRAATPGADLSDSERLLALLLGRLLRQ